MRQELLRGSHRHQGAGKGAITIERRSIPLPYPVGLATLQLSGVHACMTPNKAGPASSQANLTQQQPPRQRRGSDGKQGRGSDSATAHLQDHEAAEDVVKVNVVVKVLVKGDVGDAEAQEFVAAVLPLKCSRAATSEGGNASRRADVGRHETGAAGLASSSAGMQRHPLPPGVDAKTSKFLSSTGHLPFDKRKLNAMRREQQQQQQDSVEGLATTGEASADSPKTQWVSMPLGATAFARLDVRVQMERVRVVVELHPLVERAKRPREETSSRADHNHPPTEQLRRGSGGGPPSWLDCRLEVSVLGTISPLA